MRIGIYDPYLDDLGGGEKYMMMIAQCLSKSHDVSVFWDQKEDFERLSQRFGLELSGVTLKRNIFKSMPFRARILETQKYDLIIFLSDGSLPLTFSKLYVHIQQPLEQFEGLSLKGKLKLVRVKKIFCNSEFTKSYIEKKFGVKAIVIYPPVTLYPKEVKKENIILHVGRFRTKNVQGVDDYKKQHVMIRVFKKMIDNGLKDWKFVMAVSFHKDQEKQFQEMEKTAQAYPVEFEINRSNDELWDIYSRAKIYWHASGFGEDLETHPEFAEHFGISTVEAMGAGAVPVVINAGGQKEIVQEGENGLLWNTREELQDKTLQLIKDPKLLENLSQKARKRAEYFAGDRFCQDIKKLIGD